MKRRLLLSACCCLAALSLAAVDHRAFGRIADTNAVSITYAPSALVIDGVYTGEALLTTNDYWNAAWRSLVDVPQQTDSNHYAVAVGWANREAHWLDRVYEVRENPPPPPRKFSKLKIYGAIISLPDANGTSAWEKVKAWLEAKTISGVNGWMAFQLAQEISEDHPLFAVLADEARQLLGLTQEQFDALLNQCILED